MLIITGIIIVMFIYEILRVKFLASCPKPIIEYRYVPRTFKDEQNEPIPIDDIVGTMFSQPSPWMVSRGVGFRNRLDTRLDGRAQNYV